MDADTKLSIFLYMVNFYTRLGTFFIIVCLFMLIGYITKTN